MASLIYNSFKKDLLAGNVDTYNDTIYVLLVSSTYSPSTDSHTRRSDITNEMSTTNYTAGGAALTSKTATQDDTNDAGVWDGADVSWSTVTLTARAAVVYKSTGSGSASDPLVAYFDFLSDQSASSGTFTIQWSNSGIIRLT